VPKNLNPDRICSRISSVLASETLAFQTTRRPNVNDSSRSKSSASMS
jgi:hypothetical protein